MRERGSSIILPLIIGIIFIVLAIGSFIYTHPGFSLYSLYNIGVGNSTPAPQQVEVDKSNFIKGELLVIFNSGTLYKQAKELFVSQAVASYESVSGKMLSDNTVLDTTDIFRVKVKEGEELKSAENLKKSPLVRSATPNYIKKAN